jgi:hypothetical protein
MNEYSSVINSVQTSVSVSHVQDTVAQLSLSPSVAETLTCGLATPSVLSCMLASLMKWWINIFYLHLKDLEPTSTWGSDVRATKCACCGVQYLCPRTLVASHRVSCLKAVLVLLCRDLNKLRIYCKLASLNLLISQ